MSTANRQTWDDPNYKKMWVAFLKTHPGVNVKTEAVAHEMGATKRAIDDQLKALKREARALQTPAGNPLAHDSDSVEEDLNVYQRAKRGLPPRGVRQNRGASTATKSKGALDDGTKQPEASHPVQQQQEDNDGGDEGEEGGKDTGDSSKVQNQEKGPEEDDDTEGIEERVAGEGAGSSARVGTSAILA